MPSNSIMFCGAADTKDYQDTYNKISAEFNFAKPLNFINGDFNSDNYAGHEAFLINSTTTIDESIFVIFVIHENFGKITWETEFEHVIESGKNFLIFCHEQTYNKYRGLNTEAIKAVPILQQLDYLESSNPYGQITITVFDEGSLYRLMKDKVTMLLVNALESKEKENLRRSFINARLRGNDYKKYEEKDLTEKNEKTCRQILFDIFEVKELRKRAMEFFTYKKTLTQEELIGLCTDMEQGVSRKTLLRLADLADPAKINIEELYEEIISSLASDPETGAIRRTIKSFGEINIKMAIKYFPLFFPSDDTGTPKRIARLLERKWEIIEAIADEDYEFAKAVEFLIELCDGSKEEGKDVKKVLSELKEKIQIKINSRKP